MAMFLKCFRDDGRLRAAFTLTEKCALVSDLVIRRQAVFTRQRVIATIINREPRIGFSACQVCRGALLSQGRKSPAVRFDMVDRTAKRQRQFDIKRRSR